MVIQTANMSVDEFDTFAQRPANQDRLLEYIGGSVVEVPSNPAPSKIASLISGFIFMYLRLRDIGHLTGKSGGYMVSGERYAPDVAFISYEEQPDLAEKGYNPNPPDLAVEVISDPDNSQELADLRIKVSNYLAAGTLVWVVDPARKVVEIHEAGSPVKFVAEDEVVSGGQVLPGFELQVNDLFPERQG